MRAMSEEEREVELTGFTVGIINEPGYCEVCHHRLRVGSRAAIWRPTKELFCVICAEQVAGSKPQSWASVVPTLVFAIALFLALAFGVGR